MWFSLGATSGGRLAAALDIFGQARRYLWVDSTNGSTAPPPVPSCLSTSIATLAFSANGTLEALSVNNLAGPEGGDLEALNIAPSTLRTPDSLPGPGSGLPSPRAGRGWRLPREGSRTVARTVGYGGRR